jgi:hypothetical protein
MPARQQKISLGEMRSSGARGLLIYCADFQSVLGYEPPNRGDALAFLEFLAKERNLCGEESMALCLQGVLKGLKQ